MAQGRGDTGWDGEKQGDSNQDAVARRYHVARHGNHQGAIITLERGWT